MLYLPQSTKCCICHSLPSFVFATLYQVLYLPHSTKRCICHSLPSVILASLPSVGLTSLPRVVFATTKCCVCQSTKCYTCHSLPSVGLTSLPRVVFASLPSAVLATVYQVLLATNTSFNAALCLSRTLLSTIQPTISLVMDTTFNRMCLPQEEMPHSTQCACHKKKTHLIQTSSSLVRGTSFNQAVHLSWAPHSIQCACHKKKHLTEPSGSPVTGTSFNPMCLPQEKAPHSNKRFTCYGHLIQTNVPASKNKQNLIQPSNSLVMATSLNPMYLPQKHTNKTSFNQLVHLLRAPHSIQCACLKKRHLIQTSGSLVMGTSFNPMCLPQKTNKTSLNQAVHLLRAPHLTQCACLKKRHLIQTSSSLVTGTAFDLCLPKNNNKKTHSTSWFTFYRHLIQSNVPVSKQSYKKPSFNQPVHLLWAPHSTQCACLKPPPPPTHFIQPRGSFVMDVSFNPMCLPQKKYPTSFNQAVHLLRTSHSSRHLIQVSCQPLVVANAR